MRGRGGERGLSISGTGRDPRTLEAHGLDQVQEDREDPPVPALAFGFELDATDAIYRLAGADPYAAPRRDRALRDAPRLDARAERIREADLSAAFAELPARLLDVWSDESRAPAERRQIVFDLWDECADDRHGALARAIIEAFVRIELPAGTALAYAPAELAALDARRQSAARFDPYRQARR